MQILQVISIRIIVDCDEKSPFCLVWICLEQGTPEKKRKKGKISHHRKKFFFQLMLNFLASFNFLLEFRVDREKLVMNSDIAYTGYLARGTNVSRFLRAHVLFMEFLGVFRFPYEVCLLKWVLVVFVGPRVWNNIWI